MNLIDVLRTGKDIVATEPFTYNCENIVDGRCYPVSCSSGPIERSYFMNHIMSGLGEIDLLSATLWEPKEAEITLTESRFDEVANQVMENSRIVHNSFLGTFSNAETPAVIKAMRNILFGGHE